MLQPVSMPSSRHIAPRLSFSLTPSATGGMPSASRAAVAVPAGLIEPSKPSWSLISTTTCKIFFSRGKPSAGELGVDGELGRVSLSGEAWGIGVAEAGGAARSRAAPPPSAATSIKSSIASFGSSASRQSSRSSLSTPSALACFFSSRGFSALSAADLASTTPTR